MILVHYLDVKVGLLVLAEAVAEYSGNTVLHLDMLAQIAQDPRCCRSHFACGRLLLCFEQLRGMEGQHGVAEADRRCGQYAMVGPSGCWGGRGESIAVAPQEERSHYSHRKGLEVVVGDHRGRLAGLPLRIPVAIRNPASP